MLASLVASLVAKARRMALLAQLHALRPFTRWFIDTGQLLRAIRWSTAPQPVEHGEAQDVEEGDTEQDDMQMDDNDAEQGMHVEVGSAEQGGVHDEEEEVEEEEEEDEQKTVVAGSAEGAPAAGAAQVATAETSGAALVRMLAQPVAVATSAWAATWITPQSEGPFKTKLSSALRTDRSTRVAKSAVVLAYDAEGQQCAVLWPPCCIVLW